MTGGLNGNGAMSQAQVPRLPTRIVLCEDDPLVLDRFERLVRGWPLGQLVAVCGDLASCMAALAAGPVDLLITDVNLPDGSGIEAIRMLGQSQPAAESMVISVLADERTVLEAIEAGAAGYLLKDADGEDLVEAIIDLLEGRSPISSRIARVLIRRLAERGQSVAPGAEAGSATSLATGETPTHLTPREMDILWGISKGFTYGEIAQQLKISKQTVPVHIRNIYRKLQVSNRSEAVYEASRQGLIRL